ncbi:OmpA family protein [Sediminibacterium sp.]|uniref:OmpA family protein n=1 Tax=Sediminibacterium sp. TaxID=1917865 RepID=UPI003F71536D
MKTQFLKCLPIAAMILGGTQTSQAQEKQQTISKEINPPLFSGTPGFRKWSFGLNVGALAPFAAIGGKNDFSKWVPKLGYGASIKYQASHGFGIQLDGVVGELAANNDKLVNGSAPVSPYRSFLTKMNWSASLSGVITLANINWSQMNTTVQPYLTLGAGAVSYTPRTINNAGTSEGLSPKATAVSFFVPVGLGVKLNLTKSVNLDFGYTMAYVDNDNIDGYFKAPYIGDKYSYGHIGLEFSLGKKTKPQMATHNPPAQLHHELTAADANLKALFETSEENMRKKMAEMKGMHEEIAKMKMDIDGDGVSDYFDKCPSTNRSIKVDGAGCPLPVVEPSKDTIIRITNTYVITEEDKQIVNEAIRNLEFEFSKASIRDRSFPYLNRVAEMLVLKGFSLKLGGHTDAVGSNAANMILSKNRAESVKNYLVSKGVNFGRIEAVGYGESQPVSSNKTAAGRQKNRRVEFTLY